jgi:YidC/Oxa1 family membrane protein insertase
MIFLFNGFNTKFDNSVIEGFSIFGAIFFTTLLIKLMTLAFSFKSQQNQEKIQQLQLRVTEIQNKYKFSNDPKSRQKMQFEIMNLYRSEKISPFSSFFTMMLTFPFLYAMFIVIKCNRTLKDGNIGPIKLIVQP